MFLVGVDLWQPFTPLVWGICWGFRGPFQWLTPVTNRHDRRKPDWTMLVISHMIMFGMGTSCRHRLFRNPVGRPHGPLWNRSLCCHFTLAAGQSCQIPMGDQGRGAIWMAPAHTQKQTNRENVASSSPLSLFFDTHTHTRLVLANCLVLQGRIAFRGVI